VVNVKKIHLPVNYFQKYFKSIILNLLLIGINHEKVNFPEIEVIVLAKIGQNE